MKKEAEEKNELESEKRVSELTDRLLRLQADFDNYRKRVDKEKAEARKAVEREIALELCGLWEELDLAARHLKDEGVEMLSAKMWAMLEGMGVKEVPVELFDEDKHEAIASVESELPENSVVETVQKGFLFKGELLRAARVVVSKAKKIGVSSEASKKQAGEERE
jgi:molecular chaperone GrpE